MSDIKVPKGQEFYRKSGDKYTLVGEIKFSPALEQRLNANFGVGGAFQKFWDDMLLKDIKPYTPFITGTLFRSSINQTIIGSGELVWATPYARYLYYGKLMVDPETGKGAYYSDDFGFWSRPGVRKVLTDKYLNYTKEIHPLAGPFWADRARNDKMPQWERAAQEFIDRGKAT